MNKKKMVEKEAKDASEWSVGAKSAGKKEAEAAKKVCERFDWSIYWIHLCPLCRRLGCRESLQLRLL